MKVIKKKCLIIFFSKITFSLNTNFTKYKLIKLVSIDKGKRKYMISTISKLKISIIGVPITNTPTPAID